ncbi:hypothetical protein [Rhodococcus sp. B10]|uniref:hypothetical protein n=1 Tax=Rhodococcus sp. B10 TaxID=2695876 RepID=UPI0014308F3D|nr:hypothetical protein [Rhodococcus sp. B10]
MKGPKASDDLIPAILSGSTHEFTQTRVEWATVTDDSDRYASGPTREAAIESHLRGNRDLKQAVADLKALNPDSGWEKYTFPEIRGVRKTVTVTRTEVFVSPVETDGLPADAFGWERD